MRIVTPYRAISLAATGMAATLALTGCGGGDTDSSGTGKGLEKTTMNVSALPLDNVAPLFVAQQRGLFKKEGLTVNIKPLDKSILAVPSMLKGETDAVVGANDVSMFQADAKGVGPIMLLDEEITTLPKESGILALPNSNIKTAKDLAGKKIAVNILNSVQQMLATAALKSTDVNPNDVKWTSVDFPDMGAALQRHQVDAVYALEPWVTNIEQKLGAQIILDTDTGPVKSFPRAGVFAAKSFTDKYPNTARAFQRAYQKASAICQDDRKAVEAVLPKAANIDAKTASTITLPTFTTTNKVERVQRVADLMLQQGMIKKKLDVAPLVFK